MEKLNRLAYEHRRILAALCAGLAVLATISSLRQSAPGATVLVARHDIPSGHMITATDVRTVVVPTASRPTHRLTEAGAVGRRTAGPMREGELLTDYRVLEPNALSGYGPGAVLTTVRVAEADVVTGFRVGDRINVIAVDPNGEASARIVARNVEVVTVPASTGDSAVDAHGTAVRIVTTEKVALTLAAAALESRFTVVSSTS